MEPDLYRLVEQLIAIPSVNPMGREVNSEIAFEGRLTSFLTDWFGRLGVPWLVQDVEPGRQNVVAWLRGELEGIGESSSPLESNGWASGAVVLWEAHQDTVPVEGMTIDPFRPFVRDGRLYGRGSCDVKGPMAAMLHAFAKLSKEPAQRRATVLMACTVDEEFTGKGARVLPALWTSPRNSAKGTPGTMSDVPVPAAAIVAEPTGLNIVVAHKGVLRWRCRATGEAAHSSSPEKGTNAIYRMARIVQALERYHVEELRRRPTHALVGGPSLSVGIIRGGSSVNVVPDECWIEIDRRIAPGENPDDIQRDAIEYVAAQTDIQGIAHELPYLVMSPLPDDSNREWGLHLRSIIQRHGGEGNLVGVPYGTDAPSIAASGPPTVVFGPGSIAQAHTADEWIEIEQIETASRILFDLATGK